MAEEYINHFNAVRIRVNGTGTLRMTLYSQDEVNSHTLPTLTMAALPAKQPTVLCNFMSQRAMLDGRTTAQSERFLIRRILVFVKPVFSSYPQ